MGHLVEMNVHYQVSMFVPSLKVHTSVHDLEYLRWPALSVFISFVHVMHVPSSIGVKVQIRCDTHMSILQV